MFKFKILPVLFLTLFFTGCKEEKEDETNEFEPYLSTVVKPGSNEPLVKGQKIPFYITLKKGHKTFSALKAYINGKPVYSSTTFKDAYTFEAPTDSVALGLVKVKIDVEFGEQNSENYNYDVLLLSEKVPTSYGYEVVDKYTHDKNAYTQGLYFENGFMYEGTGLEGKSELRYVDFKQNKIIRSKKLDQIYFGEGVAVVGDKIYQLTYRSQKGFVYQKNSFELIKEFNYSSEGWGLTYDGKSLIRSDGSHQLHYYNPETLEFEKTLQVVDNKGLVLMLNELEWINGEIWANIYTTDYIVRINPQSGEVVGRIDLSGLLTEVEQMQGVDVLNGIAFDESSGKIYVTGKLWPWLFSIKLKNQK